MSAPDEGHIDLRILETTDLHMNVLPFDYLTDGPTEGTGLARLATLVRAARAEVRNALLFDNGDYLQGNPMGDVAAADPSTVHPINRAMALVGYDAGTIGNHEFDYGLEFLEKALADAPFPRVSANLRSAGTSDTWIAPHTILSREMTTRTGTPVTLKIGVIGFLPPQTMQWAKRHLQGRLDVDDIVKTAASTVPTLRAAGADLVVALSHSGIGPADPIQGMENASAALASVPGIDVILAGHTHRLFPGSDHVSEGSIDALQGRLGKIPAVMAGFWGTHLGVIDLELTRSTNGWSVTASTSEARPLPPTTPAAPDIVAALAKDHDATRAFVARSVGRAETPIQSYFSLVRDDSALQIVSDAQIWHAAKAFAGTEFEHLPILSATTPFKAGGRAGASFYTDVPAGDLTIRSVSDIYLYPNSIRAVRLTGAELRGWLERAAGLFNQIAPGAVDAPLHDPNFAAHNFDMIDGVSYRIDISQPARYDADGVLTNPEAWRVTDLAHQGRPVTDDMTFAVITNNYRADGGGGFPGADGTTVIYEAQDANRDILARYIQAQGTVRPRPDHNWSLAPMPGTSALFETGSGAERYLDDPAGPKIEPIGPGANGFTRYRVRL